MNSHRQRARRRTVTWQATSLALVAGAIAVGALPISGLLGPGKSPKPKVAEITKPQSGPSSLSQTRVLRLHEVMDKNAGKTEVVVADKDPEPTPIPEDTGPEATVAAVQDVSWHYVGRMGGADPRSQRAIVNVSGGANEPSQKMLLAGDEVDNTKLVSIAPDHIMISVGGAEATRIDLAQRSANAAWNSESPRRAGGAIGRGMPGQTNFPAGSAPGMNPMNPMNPNNPANLAEAQRRMKAAISPVPTPPPAFQPPQEDRMAKLTRMAKEMGEMGPDKRDALNKIVEDPGLSPEERGRMLTEIGIPLDATPDERGEYLHMIGITPESDPKLYERLRDTGGAK